MTTVRRGTLLSFDATTWLALVLLEGADMESQLPVGQWVPSAMMVANVEVAVLVFDATNTDDGVVLGAYGSLGAGAPTGGLFNSRGTIAFASVAVWRTVATITFASADYAAGYLIFAFGGIQQAVASAKAVLIGTFDKNGAGNPTFTSISNIVANCTVQAVPNGATQLVVQMESSSGANQLQGTCTLLVLGGAIFSITVAVSGYSD